MAEQDSDALAILDVAQAMIRDLDGRIRFWSSGAARLYGWQKEEALGQISHQLLMTEFPKRLAAIQADLLNEGHWQGELRHRTRDQREVHVASYWALQRDENRAPVAIVEVNNDITARAQAEAARRQLAAIAESSDDAIIGKSLDGTVTAWNPAAERMFGYTAEEIIAKQLPGLFPTTAFQKRRESLIASAEVSGWCTSRRCVSARTGRCSQSR